MIFVLPFRKLTPKYSRSEADDDSRSRAVVFLQALSAIYPILPPAVAISLRRYYKVLGRYYRLAGLDPQALEALRNAAVNPLRLDSQPSMSCHLRRLKKRRSKLC